MTKHTKARAHLRAVANGQAINAVYKLGPKEALEAFKADIHHVLDTTEHHK